jgi:hypothetical protein
LPSKQTFRRRSGQDLATENRQPGAVHFTQSQRYRPPSQQACLVHSRCSGRRLHSALHVRPWTSRRFLVPQGRVAESGLRHSTRNRAWGNPPWVRIPPLPLNGLMCRSTINVSWQGRSSIAISTRCSKCNGAMPMCAVCDRSFSPRMEYSGTDFGERRRVANAKPQRIPPIQVTQFSHRKSDGLVPYPLLEKTSAHLPPNGVLQLDARLCASEFFSVPDAVSH